MKKIQFGCGGNHIHGWENYDAEIDITKPLPFENGVASHTLAEHVMEHITIQEAWNFMKECHRILQSGGYMRIAVPSVSKIFENANQEYFNFTKNRGWGEANMEGALKSIIFNHGHQAIWERCSLEAIVKTIGFEVLSDEPDGMEGTLNHGRAIGQSINDMETIHIDCKKI